MKFLSYLKMRRWPPGISFLCLEASLHCLSSETFLEPPPRLERGWLLEDFWDLLLRMLFCLSMNILVISLSRSWVL